MNYVACMSSSYNVIGEKVNGVLIVAGIYVLMSLLAI